MKTKRLQSKKLLIFGGFLASLIFLFSTSFGVASAYSITNTDLELTGSYVLSPAKMEVVLDPGETATKTISITNLDEETTDFTIDIEDFRGSDDTSSTIVLLGEERGPYSLQDYIEPEVREFTLRPGERIMLPVQVSIPEDATPGGLYGSVLIKNKPDEDATGAQTISRLGSLLFVRVAGDVKMEGQLEEFGLARENKAFYSGGPFDFEFLYKNTGNVHSILTGNITITNTFGSPVEEIQIEPYFALPDASRYRKISWNRDVLLGRYQAELRLNRGYGPDGGIVDTKTITFWVLPWKWIIGVFAGLFVIIALFYFLFTRVDVSIKKK